MGIKYDLHDIVEGKNKQTNFMSGLIRLCFKADALNLERLRAGFPEAVRAVEHYRVTGEITEGTEAECYYLDKDKAAANA